MSQIKILTYTIFLIFLFSKINSNPSTLKVITNNDIKNNIANFEEDEDEDDLITKDQNCNKTEYPENAKKCNLDNMICEDTLYLHKCRCKDGYITYSINKNNETKYCEVEQKKQLYAFWLEFCLGFGAGHFYRHAYSRAIWKLCLFLFGLVFICSFPITAKFCSDHSDFDCLFLIVSIIFYLFMIFLAVWYIYDLVNFGKNNFKDLTYYPIEIDLKKW